MKVLHLDSGREMRGGQWQALRLHRALVGAGHESLLLARQGSPLLSAAREWKLPCAPPGARLQRFDIVHAHDARSHTLGLFVRGPLVVSRRVAFPVKDSPLSRWKYRRPALFLAVSRFVADELRRAGVDESRIAVIHDSVPVPPQPACGDEVLVPYTLDPAKGMALAEEAAALAGVRLKRSEDLPADLPKAKALIYLTHSEGLGSGVLLGMAYGVTVIASNVGGVPELIEDGVNGILVPNEPQAVAKALARMDERLGQAARQTVRERFTEETMLQATLAAYERVLRNA